VIERTKRVLGTAVVRTVVIPHLQTSVAVWALKLDSELVFAGDAGTTEAGRPSRRFGIEWANYYSPRAWLTFDGDVSVSSAHFNDGDPSARRIPGAVRSVISAGATVNSVRNAFGSIRLRYFGPRPLTENGSVRSKSTSVMNAEVGYKLTEAMRIAVDVFNIFNAKASDTDYYYSSRLPGEPLDGVNDVHFHPMLPRTARVNLIVGF
jgi:outer membrane receptor protein involved in Fe transport